MPPPQDGRSDLLAQIQAGKKLKHVQPPAERGPGQVVAAGGDGGGGSDGRDAMMQQIRGGAQLRSVSIERQFQYFNYLCCRLIRK